MTEKSNTEKSNPDEASSPAEKDKSIRTVDSNKSKESLERSDRIKNLKTYVDTAMSRKAEDIIILDVHNLTSYTDTIIIMTGNSARQVSSMGEYIYKTMKSLGNAPIGFEGIKEGKWALLDFGDVIVHVFDEKTRALYNIEGLWSDALRISLSEFGY